MAQNDDFSALPQAEYDGIAFPYISVELTHGSAAAFHKFAHRPGQRVEYTGREAVAGQMILPMFATLINEHGGSHAYWPTGIILLRERAQEQKSKKLVVPVFGTLDRAFIRIQERYDAVHRDGAYVTLTFAEDSTDLIAKGTAATAASRVAAESTIIDNALAALQLAATQKIEDLQGNSYSDFVTACSALLAMKDQAQTTLADRITMCDRVITSIDALMTGIVSTLSDPVGWEARNAALNLKESLVDLKHEGTAAAAAVKQYTLAGVMTVADVASATRNSVTEVLNLNSLPNGLAIDAGEVLTVYDR